MADTLVLTMSCPDRVGIVAAVTGFLAGHGGWITEANYHADAGSGWFFMRQAILAESLDFPVADFPRLIEPLARQFGLSWTISESRIRKRTVILVSRQDHCLSDLLHRWRTGELNIEIVAVVSNHPDLESFVAWHGVPFHYVPVAPEMGRAPFEEIARIFSEARGEVMVLARYMRILPPVPLRTIPRPDHQHPPQLSSVLRRLPPLPPGLREGRQAHWRHLPLCQRRTRRRSDHRPGRDPGRPRRLPGGNGAPGAGHRKNGPGAGSPLPCRGPGPHSRE